MDTLTVPLITSGTQIPMTVPLKHHRPTYSLLTQELNGLHIVLY